MLASNTYPGQGLDQDRDVVGERLELAREMQVGDPIQEGAFWDGQKWVFWKRGRWAYYNEWRVLKDWRKVPVILMELKPDSLEYRTVTDHFLSSMLGQTAIIQRVFRVQNWKLWNQFSQKRTEMMKQRGGETVKEWMLFHGTPHDNVDSICRTGFDSKQRQRSKDPLGVCFARDSDRAHKDTLITLVGDHYPDVIQSAFPLPPQPPRASSSTADQLTNPQAVTQCCQQPQNGSGLQKIPPPDTLPPPGALPPPDDLPPAGQQYRPQLTAADPVGVEQQTQVGFAPPPPLPPPPPPPHHPVGVEQQPQVGFAPPPPPPPHHPVGVEQQPQVGFAPPPPPPPHQQVGYVQQPPYPSDKGPLPGFPGDGLHYMFVTRVLVGRSTDSFFLNKRLPARVNSTVDNAYAPLGFRILNKSQAYPEYLLEYFSVP